MARKGDKWGQFEGVPDSVTVEVLRNKLMMQQLNIKQPLERMNHGRKRGGKKPKMQYGPQIVK